MKKGLTAAALKVIACISMAIDHVGLAFFPEVAILRVMGRLAFPLFAFFIAEGCRYTRHKWRRFLQIFSLGLVCEVVYYLYSGVVEGTVLMTFTFSILIIHALQYWKRTLLHPGGQTVLASVGLVAALALGVMAGRHTPIDYGVFGVLLPVFLSFLDYKEGEYPAFFARLDRLPCRLVVMAAGLLLLWWNRGRSGIQFYALLAVIPLTFYNGRPGTRRLKYLFYIFYPLHLVLIAAIAAVIERWG